MYLVWGEYAYLPRYEYYGMRAEVRAQLWVSIV